jgi:hypothetical protein
VHSNKRPRLPLRHLDRASTNRMSATAERLPSNALREDDVLHALTAIMDKVAEAAKKWPNARLKLLPLMPENKNADTTCEGCYLLVAVDPFCESMLGYEMLDLTKELKP